MANWQRAGDEHARRPEPVERPGVGASAPVRTLTPSEKDALNRRLGGAFLQQRG